MNKVILMGRLTRDPETRYSQSAEPIAVSKYSLAITRKFKRDNEPDVDFINCVAFGKSGEFADRYFKKGQMVAVVGRLSVNKWQDKNGENRYSTEVVVEEQHFAESKSSFENRMASSKESSTTAQQPQDQFENSANQYKSQQNQPVNNDNDGFYPIDNQFDEGDLPF